MELPRTVHSHAGHRVCAIVLLVACAALIGQLVALGMMSDDSILAVVRLGARKERDKKDQELRDDPIMFKRYHLSDEELDRRIEASRGELLVKAKGEMGFSKLLLMKGLVCFLLAGIAWGLWRGRRSPTRLLAAILGVLLIIGSVKIIGEIQGTLNVASQLMSASILADLVASVMIPVACLFCFVAASSALWKVRPGGTQEEAKLPGRMDSGVK